MLNRRNLLVLGGMTLGGATFAGAVGRAVLLPDVAGQAPTHEGHHLASTQVVRDAGTGVAPTVAPFSVEMPVPRVLRPIASHLGTDYYQMPIQAANVEILPGLRTPAFTYGGEFVGPTIKARTGRRVRIAYRNQLDRAANVHLHGAHVPASSDGHPMDVIQPGQTKLYDYPNTQQGTTLWYHDHSHHTEAENVYHGLQGFYLIEDDAERHLRLPDGEFDVPIVLRDAKFDSTGALIFYDDPVNRTTILANGKPVPYFRVARRKYRFRLLNGATKRIFYLNLGGAEMLQIGSDGGLLPAPVPRTELVLGSAERQDVVIDFSRYPIGSQLVLSDGVGGPVLRFDVSRTAPDFSRVPDRLRPLPVLPPATVEREVTMAFDFSVGPIPLGLINGRPYDPARNDFEIKRGTTEIWRIVNADPYPVHHTFHMHLVQFQVVDRDGAPPTLDDAGRKDTVVVEAGKSVRVKATFGDYLGQYAYHCHFLEHSSFGMMSQMNIVA